MTLLQQAGFLNAVLLPISKRFFCVAKRKKGAALGKAGRSHRQQMSPPEAVCGKPESYVP